jgi:hypothetical protein
VLTDVLAERDILLVTDPVFELLADLHDVGLPVPVFDVVTEPVPVADIHDVREDVVLRVTVGVPLLDTVKVADILGDPLSV